MVVTSGCAGFIFLLVMSCTNAVAEVPEEEKERDQCCDAVSDNTLDVEPHLDLEPPEPQHIKYVEPTFEVWGQVRKRIKSRYSYTRGGIWTSFPTMPVCYTCNICLAIAEKLYETLLAVTQSDLNCKLDEAHIIEAMRSVCENGFENYDLREINKHWFVTEASIYSKHVTSALDGLWPDKLKHTCYLYLREYGEIKLYHTWSKGITDVSFNINNQLCRGSGLFRDCLNLKENEEECNCTLTNPLQAGPPYKTHEHRNKKDASMEPIILLGILLTSMIFHYMRLL